MAPNRMTAYQNARAAAKPQKGLTYSELLMDNLIGLDNDYLSAGERLGQEFNADEIGFLKNAGISAYEGAKKAVTQPLTTAEELLSGLYDSGVDIASTLGTDPTYLDDALREMYGVGYDEATDEQVNRAREALFGDVLNVGSVATGLGAASRGIGSIAATRADNISRRRNLEETIAEYESRSQREASAADNDDFLPPPPDVIDLPPGITDPRARADYDPRAGYDDPGGQGLARYFDDQFPSILEEAQLGRPLTEREAYDVMMYERYGDYGILDPNNTFDDWLQGGGDTEGARRIAYLTDPTNPQGRAEPMEYDDIYDQLNPPNDTEVQPQAPARFADWDDSEYYGLVMYHDMDEVNLSPAEEARLRQYDTVRFEELRNGAAPDYPEEYEIVGLRLNAANNGAQPQDWAIPVQNMMDQGLLLQDVRPRAGYEVRPAVGQAEGIAGLYSPTRKAVDLLDRPSYDDLDSLRGQLLNRGAKPDELEGLMAKIPGTKNNPMSAEQVEAFLNDPKAGQFSKEDLARFADEASQDVVVSTRNLRNSPRDNPYYLNDNYFLRGAEDIGANVFELNAGAQRVFGGGVPDTAFRHFKPSSDDRAPILHTRFGMFRSPGADKPDTYHLGEIQSDWAQTRQRLYPTRKEYDSARDKLDELNEKYDEAKGRQESLRRAPADETLEQFEERNRRFVEVNSELSRIEKERSPISQKLSDTENYGSRDEYDEKFAAPYVGTTSKWVQLGLRQSLLDAVNKGAKRMTVSTGEQVKEYTFGKEGGQSKFYDEIVLKELDDVLKKFAKEAGIRKPEITTSKIVGSRRQEYTVPTVEFTDEFVEALKRVGLPAYAKGGIVKGSYLDNDPLEPALY